MARNILEWNIRKYSEHPTEWKWVLNTLTRDLALLYTYDPYPLSRSYLSKYLSRTLSDDRSEWKKYYFATGEQHEDMPDAAFAAWQPWWVSEEGRSKLEQMKQIRTLVRPQQSNNANIASSPGGILSLEETHFSPSTSSPYRQAPSTHVN